MSIVSQLKQIEEFNKADEFQKAYLKAKTWADLDQVYQAYSLDDLKILKHALEITKAFTGIDMRQQFLLTCITSYLRYNEEKEDD